MLDDLGVEIQVDMTAFERAADTWRRRLRALGPTLSELRGCMTEVSETLGNAVLPILGTIAGLELGERLLLDLDAQAILGRQWEEWNWIFDEPDFSCIWDDYNTLTLTIRTNGRFSGMRYDMMHRISRRHIQGELGASSVLVGELNRVMLQLLYDHGPCERFSRGDLLLNGMPFRVSRSTISRVPMDIDHYGFGAPPCLQFVGNARWELECELEQWGENHEALLTIAYRERLQVSLLMRCVGEVYSGTGFLTSFQHQGMIPISTRLDMADISRPMGSTITLTGDSELEVRRLREGWDTHANAPPQLAGHVHHTQPPAERLPLRYFSQEERDWRHNRDRDRRTRGRVAAPREDWELRPTPHGERQALWEQYAHGMVAAGVRIQPSSDEQNEAKARALALLNSGLTVEQQEHFAEYDSFKVVSQSGVEFLISRGRVQNIERLSDGHVFCINFRDSMIPTEDLLLAQAAMLTTNEEGFYEVANEFGSGVLSLGGVEFYGT